MQISLTFRAAVTPEHQRMVHACSRLAKRMRALGTSFSVAIKDAFDASLRPSDRVETQTGHRMLVLKGLLRRSCLRMSFKLAGCIIAGSWLFWPIVVRSSEVKLAGPAATWYDLVVVTNSVCGAAVLSELDHTIASTSQVDTCLSLLPEWGAWRDVPGGMFNVWIETVADSSNTVSVLLGDPETPVLTIDSAKDWSVTTGGAFPSDDPIIPRFGVTTNRVHLAVHFSARFGFGQAVVETQTAGGSWTSRTNLVPLRFGWFDIPQRIPNWTKVGVCIAGPRAALTDLHLQWSVDPTVLIIR